MKKNINKLGVLSSILILICDVTFASALGFKVANSSGAIGEIEHLYLLEKGLQYHFHYNDFIGDTDKLVTGGTKLNYLNSYKSFNYEAKLSWRFVTPIVKQKFGADLIEPPIGRYADWAALQFAVERPFSDLFGSALLPRWQVSLGIDQIGDKNAKQVHRWIHRVFKAPVLGTDYTNQPKGVTFNAGVEVSVVLPTIAFTTLNFESLFALGYSYNLFMSESYQRLNNILKLNENLVFAIESKVIQQHSSSMYNAIKAKRLEFAFSMLAWNVYKPAIKYVSDYLVGDDFRQIIIDPLVFNFIF